MNEADPRQNLFGDIEGLVKRLKEMPLKGFIMITTPRDWPTELIRTYAEAIIIEVDRDLLMSDYDSRKHTLAFYFHPSAYADENGGAKTKGDG